MENASGRRLNIRRRDALTALGALGLAGAGGCAGATAPGAEDLAAQGRFVDEGTGRLMQGGFYFGRTLPRAPVAVDGKPETVASASGLYLVGFDRDAPAEVNFGPYVRGGWRTAARAITPVTYDVQHVDGLPPETVTPTKPEIIARIAAERVKKVAAAESRDDSEDFKDGFVLPLEHPIRTSPFGVQRVLNGEPKPPHYGLDLAAPQGTTIRAPAPGLVVLAEPDLFLEGGLVMIDHGQGLISFYLHQSRVVARAGQRIRRGEVIGEVGMKGRATGPHLCWRLGWRGRHMDPSLLIGATAPAAA